MYLLTVNFQDTQCLYTTCLHAHKTSGINQIVQIVVMQLFCNISRNTLILWKYFFINAIYVTSIDMTVVHDREHINYITKLTQKSDLFVMTTKQTLFQVILERAATNSSSIRKRYMSLTSSNFFPLNSLGSSEHIPKNDLCQFELLYIIALLCFQTRAIAHSTLGTLWNWQLYLNCLAIFL